jgi:hypothetical protein
MSQGTYTRSDGLVMSDGLPYTSWRDYADSRELNECENIIQDALRITMVNKDIRISQHKGCNISFYLQVGKELHIKQITEDKFIEDFAKNWCDIAWMMPFVKWEKGFMYSCKRIIELFNYDKIIDIVETEAGEMNTLDVFRKDMSHVWAVRDIHDVSSYMEGKQKEKVQKDMSYKKERVC